MKLGFLLLCLLFPAHAQLRVDPQLAAEIAKIKAIDNHAHPVRAVGEGEKNDNEYDALPVEVLEPWTEPFRLRPENANAGGAWRELFGYPHSDHSTDHIRELRERKKRIQREQGERYPAWVLDKVGIETMFANRVAMGRSLPSPRFRWVPFADALMYPLDNAKLAAQNKDYKTFFGYEDRLRKRYLSESGYQARPRTLDEYLRKVVTATLERQKQNGAVAVKFEAAYLRSLDFGNPSRADTERVYQRGGAPELADYKTLQDYIFRHIALDCGRLGLPVHLHSSVGAGGYFGVGGANPLRLEPLLNDPALRKTNFVFVHGGWPFTREVAALLTKPNAYADFSAQTMLLYARSVSQSIREWLEYAPDKVLFGTDAYPFSEDVSWEEAAWIAATTGRQALGLALTGMLLDGQISRERAVELARLVLRDNARRLYGM